MFTVTKTFRGFSTAHRQWRANSHCRFVHGYDRWFDIEFGCSHLDRHGWVVDFGGLEPIKQALADQFDHTMIIAPDDPQFVAFRDLDEVGAVDLRVMGNPGMEGAAEWTWAMADRWVRAATDERVWVVSVTAGENDKNRVTYRP